MGAELDDRFQFLTGGPELLDRLAPLWRRLRDHHARVSVQFGEDMARREFEDRRRELAAKADGMWIELAVDRASGNEAGYVIATQSPDGRGEIDSIYVRSAHRGSGLGHCLLDRALDWLTGRGADKISIQVVVGNEAAHGFYARHGFYPRNTILTRKIERNESD